MARTKTIVTSVLVQTAVSQAVHESTAIANNKTWRRRYDGDRCANPAHVEPVTRIENVARRTARNMARRLKKPYGPKTCGPAINWDAAEARRGGVHPGK